MNAKVKSSKALVLSELSGAQQRLAARAIEDVHLAYYEKGGLRETIQQVETQAEGVSGHIYKLAVHAAKNSSSIAAGAQLFAVLCEHAERQYKADHEIDNIKDQLPVWAVFKSNILGAMRAGLSPLDHRNEHALRNANKATRPVAALERGAPTAVKALASFLATTAVHSSLRKLAARTVHSLESIKSSERRQAASVLREANRKLAPLADRRRADRARAGAS